MKLEEAKQILKEHNYLVEWGYDHYCNPFNQMNQKRIRARAELKNQLIGTPEDYAANIED